MWVTKARSQEKSAFREALVLKQGLGFGATGPCVSSSSA
jgi:hypothetical protein